MKTQARKILISTVTLIVVMSLIDCAGGRIVSYKTQIDYHQRVDTDPESYTTEGVNYPDEVLKPFKDVFKEATYYEEEDTNIWGNPVTNSFYYTLTEQTGSKIQKPDTDFIFLRKDKCFDYDSDPENDGLPGPYWDYWLDPDDENTVSAIEDSMSKHSDFYSGSAWTPALYLFYTNRICIDHGWCIEKFFGRAYNVNELRCGESLLAVCVKHVDDALDSNDISGSADDHVKHITAHEIGHAFDFTGVAPEDKHLKNHCEDEECFMCYPHPEEAAKTFSKNCLGGGEGHFHELADTVGHKP